LIQYGWETVTEALKHGGITNMMDRLNNPSKIEAYRLADELKDIMRPLFQSTWMISFQVNFQKT
jgi:ketol-acid reductoisomerase